MAFARSVRVSRRYATCQIENHQTSDALPGTVRSFASYRAIATEAGLSRIYAGQHTPLDDVAGQQSRPPGAQVAVRRSRWAKFGSRSAAASTAAGALPLPPP